MHLRVPASARGILMAGTLVGLLALSIYGFWSRHLFQQAIWQSPGPERFLLFLVVMCVGSAATILLRPRWLVPLTCAVTALYTIAAVGILPLAATTFFLFACFVLGRLLLSWSDTFRGVVPDLIALLAGMSAVMWLIAGLAHFPVNYPATYLAILAAVLMVKPGNTAACMRRVAGLFLPAQLKRRRDYMLLAVALTPLLAHWLVVLKPEIGEDALSMHMVVPAYVAEHHLWSFDFRHLVWAILPMGGDWCYTIPYLFGGEFAARLLNLAVLGVICALLYHAALRWVGRPTAFLLTGLFAATPVVQLVTGSLFVETFYAAMCMGAMAALWHYRSAGDRPALLASAFLLASAMGVKLIAVLFVAPVGVVLMWALWREARTTRGGGTSGSRADRAVRPTVRPLWLIAGTIAVMALAAGPYLYSWWKTGNPAFPYLNNIFHSPYFSQAYTPDSRFSEPLTWRTPFDVTFETHRYWEGQDGSAGFQFFWLFPLVLLSIRRDWRFTDWTLVAVAVAGTFAGLLLRPNVRYLYPAFPLLTLSLALIFRGGTPRFRYAAASACAVCLALNLGFLPSSSWYHKMFCFNPFDRHEAESYVAINAPARLLVDRLNHDHPGESALFLETMDIAGLRGEAYSDGWHDYLFMERVTSLQTEVEVLRLFRELGIGHFIFPIPESGTPVREAQVRRFLARFTDTEADRGSMRLSRLRPELAVSDLPAWATAGEEPAAAPRGEYDDLDPRIRFVANWSHDLQFDSAAGHSLTYSDTVGARFRFKFKGSAIGWIYTRASNRGIAETYIDGLSRGEVDLYSPTTVWQARTVLTTPGDGEHTFEVRILGKKNPGSSGSFVDVDRLIVQ
jgi:hypothetical protein